MDLAAELAELQEKYAALQHDYEEQQRQLQQARDKLNTEYQLLLTLIRNLPILVYIKDRQGRFVLANPATMKQWGWQSKADYYGKTDADFQSAEYAASFHAEESTIMESGLPIIRDERQDSSGHWHVATKIPLYNEAGEVIGLIGFNETISDIKQLEEAQQYTTRLLAMAMHEFNTPLATIMLSVQMLQKYQDKLSQEQITERLGRIYANGLRMSQLVQDVHAIIVDGLQRLSFKPRQVNIVDLCRRIIYKYADEAAQGIRYEPPEDRLLVTVDPNLMEYVLDNLISNALKYSPAAQGIHIESFIEAEQLVLRVHDRGIGIPHDEQTQVFEDFFRASNVGEIGGTGLGLAIVSEFVKRHQGSIHLESEEGRGTTITVRIPV